MRLIHHATRSLRQNAIPLDLRLVLILWVPIFLLHTRQAEAQVTCDVLQTRVLEILTKGGTTKDAFARSLDTLSPRAARC